MLPARARLAPSNHATALAAAALAMVLLCRAGPCHAELTSPRSDSEPGLAATAIAGTLASLDVPKGFGSLHADAPRLARYGFPPRPDAAQGPAAYRAWAKAVDGMQRIAPQLQPVALFHGPMRDAHAVSGATANSAATSSNWSGYVVAAQAFSYGAQSLTAIHGDWTVPEAQPPFGACKAVPDGEAVFSSTWVGLDGNGSADVLQAGTESDAVCSKGKVSAYQGAWYEWYPYDEVRVANLPVSPGQAMYVQVWATGPTTGNAYIANKSTHKAVSVQFTAPPGVTLIGNSGEWILERPSLEGTLTDLTNYVQEFMAGAGAVDAQSIQYDPGIGLVPGRQPALQIKMTDAGKKIISVPSLLGSDGIWFTAEGSAQTM